jgi:Prokaryotic E2 family E
MLPQYDAACLSERGIRYSVSTEANMICVVLHDYRLPLGYDHGQADLLLRLSPGFPDIRPDMWWFAPAIRLSDGRVIKATEVTEHHLGRSWQRWSRHFNEGQWRSGIDSLESYLALIGKELERCVQNPN